MVDSMAGRTVLAARRCRPNPLPHGIVRKILEAARAAASSLSKYPWHFIVAGRPQELARLGKLARTVPCQAEAGRSVAVTVEDTKYAFPDAGRPPIYGVRQWCKLLPREFRPRLTGGWLSSGDRFPV